MLRSLSRKAAAARFESRLTEMVIVPSAWKLCALPDSGSWMRSSEICWVQVRWKTRSRRGRNVPRAIAVSTGAAPSYRLMPCAPTWQPASRSPNA